MASNDPFSGEAEISHGRALLVLHVLIIFSIATGAFIALALNDRLPWWAVGGGVLIYGALYLMAKRYGARRRTQ